MSSRIFILLVVLILAADQALGVPASLGCEGSENPGGIDTIRPKLSWIIEADDPSLRGVKQTAYEIVAASSLSRLENPDPDLWDSQRVLSGKTVGIAYEGRPLQSGQQIFWKVRVWTGTDQPGPWSAVCNWTMGLLSAQDWGPARWIGDSGAKASGKIGYHARPTQEAEESKWVQVDLGRSGRIDSVRLFPMNHAGVKGFAFPIRFRIEGSDDPAFLKSISLADQTRADFANPGSDAVAFAANTSARYVRITATKLVHRDNGYCFALAELAVLSGRTNLALNAPVTAQDSVEQFGWSTVGLTDGDTGEGSSSSGSILLRHDLTIRPALRHATLFLTGLGQYEVSINGKKVGDQLLAPGWTNYRKTVLYDTFDVTGNLHSGGNAIGIILGNGMYNIQPTPGRYVKFTQSFGPLKAIARLQLEYDDGTRDVVASDHGWQVSPGPVTYSNIFGGEDFDARLEQSGWDQFGFAPTPGWANALEIDGPGGFLRGHSAAAPPIRAIESHMASELAFP